MKFKKILMVINGAEAENLAYLKFAHFSKHRNKFF